MTALPLTGRAVLLIVGGGIAAYKAVALARECVRLGATVETVLTDAAQRFVGGVSFAGVTGRPARTELWDPSFAGELHVELSLRADIIVVAPATADLLARAAHGLADDLATTVLLCARGPVLVAPAMHARMWEHPATQANVTTLRERGVRLVGPVVGALASGEIGAGRMSEPSEIAAAIVEALAGDLRGTRVLVTAGPTHEPLDPVRFVGNRSSGKMGVAIAERARARGAEVTLVHGPMSAPVPDNVKAVAVRTALEMRDAVVPLATAHDVVVMAAAIADYRPAEAAPEKLKKGADELTVRLVRNPDVLAELGASRGTSRRPVLIGFALETSRLIEHAREKLTRKGCDLVVANLARHGFEGDSNVVTLVWPAAQTELPASSKLQIADRILDAALALARRDDATA